MKKIIVSNKDVRYFIINDKGRIIESGDFHKEDWDRTYIDLNKLKEGENLIVSFNLVDNKRIGLKPVWTELNFKIKKIKNYEKIN